MNKNIVLLVSTLVLVFSTYAQTPVVSDNSPVTVVTPSTGSDSGGGGGVITTPNVPASVPLASFKTLKAYALTLVGQVSVQVWGSSVSGDNYRWAYYPYTEADPDGMAATAASLKLHFSATTDDLLTSYVSYDSRQIVYSDPESPTGTNSTSFSLFYGERKFKLEAYIGAYNEGWRVPTNAYDVELDFPQVPFVIPGMRDAYIIERDTNGNQVGSYSFREHSSYWMDRGVIFLTEELVSRIGEMNVVMSNGSKIVYNLATGNLKPTATVEMVGFKPTIKGIRSVPANTTNIVYLATDEIVRTSYTKELWSQISFPANLERYPTKVYLMYTSVLAADPNAKWFEYNPYTEPVRFKIEVGHAILLRFEYPAGSQPPLNNGGMGKG